MADTISAVKNTAKEEKEEGKEEVRTLKDKAKEYRESDLRARVQENTPEEINRQIRRDLDARVLYFARRPDEIDRRLAELDREWDIERLLEANAGILSLTGLTFGMVHRRWHLLPIAAAAFLTQHAIQGWCPPASLFRRLGIRTAWEINHERCALKALRGDFEKVLSDDSAEERARRAIAAAEASA
jgi:hypothetical protein